MPGILAGLLSKLAGLGSVAKGGLAAATAALTMTVAGGATGVLPLPGSHAEPTAVVQSAVHPDAVVPVAASGSASASTAAGTGLGAATAASGSTSGGTTSAHVAVGAVTPPPTSPAATSSPQVPAAVGRTLPTLPPLPALPACVKELIPAKGTVPDPSTFVSKLVACVRSLVAAHLPAGGIEAVIGSSNLPTGVSKCLSSVFASMPSLAGGASSALPPSMSAIVAACAPAGAFPGMGSTPIPGLGSVPGKSQTATGTSGR